MTKITIERETLERIYNWIGKSHEPIETDLYNALRAALAAQPTAPDVLISKLANLRCMATERHVPEVDLATIDLAIDHLRYFSVTPSHRLSDARMDGIYNAWRDMGDDVSYGDLMRMVEAEIQGGK